MITEIDPLDDGISYVKMEGTFGGDIDVVNSSRVSFAKKIDEMQDKDRKLISYLAREDHGTPFEHNFLKFEIKAPIFVFREWHRHRVGWSYNEQSMRYLEGGVDVPIEFYLPGKFRRQSKSNRQASAESFSNCNLTADMLMAYGAATSVYRKMIEAGVAREIARVVLPVGMYSCMIASCNLRSLLHFLKLRLGSNAQWEIRQYAKALLKLAQPVFPDSISNWLASNGYDSEGEKKG